MSPLSWLKTLAALLAGCSLPSPAAVQLLSIDDAVTHPTAKTFTFTAVSRQDVRGVFVSTLRHPASVGVSEPSRTELWVVPLQPPGSEPSDEVRAWVCMRDPVSGGTPPDAWLRRLAAELDGQPLTLKVAARAGAPADRENTWRQAITDAETRSGVRSHPDAPIFSFPKR